MTTSMQRRVLLLALASITVAACSAGDATTTATTSSPVRSPIATAPESTGPATSTASSRATSTSTSTTTSTVPPTTTARTSSTTTSTTTTTTATSSTTTTIAAAARTGSIYDVRPPSALPAPPLPDGWTTQSLGTSVQGRDITAFVRPVEAPTRGILVIGGIHGNEPASPPTVRAFVDATFGEDVAVWLVPELNPDGVAAGTRWNANGVDLNRNFGWDWRASDGGPGPLSEPETAAITGFIEATRPGVIVWVHQPYGYVGSVGDTARSFESAWSAGSGLPTRSGVTQHGGGETWTVFQADLPALLIEIDTWAATEQVVTAQLAGFRALLAELAWDE